MCDFQNSIFTFVTFILIFIHLEILLILLKFLILLMKYVYAKFLQVLELCVILYGCRNK